ncbi:MAK10-like protein, partial [Tanacetum coccineum]
CNWLERLPARSITTWEDLTTRFLAQFFPPGRNAKLRNDILMFQQHYVESLYEAWTRFKDLLQKVSRHGIDLWLQVQIFYDQALLEDLALYDNESWNDPRDFAKPVKAISLPQDVSSTSDRRLIELENQVQRLMEAHLALTLGDSKPFDTLADLRSCVNIIPLYLFKKPNIGLLEETDHIFELVDGTKSYPIGIVKDVEVHIGKLQLLNNFYVTDMKKDLETPLLVGRGFLATANAVIDCRMAKIAVG